MDMWRHLACENFRCGRLEEHRQNRACDPSGGAFERTWVQGLDHQTRPPRLEEPSLEVLLGRFDPADIVIIEGYKGESHPKIETHHDCGFHNGANWLEVPLNKRLKNDCFALPQGVHWTPVSEALDYLRGSLQGVTSQERVSFGRLWVCFWCKRTFALSRRTGGCWSAFLRPCAIRVGDPNFDRRDDTGRGRYDCAPRGCHA